MIDPAASPANNCWMPTENPSQSVLTRSDLGAALTDGEFEQLWQLCHERGIDPETTLFSQHTVARHTYVVTEGVMRVEKLSASGRRQVVAFLFAGDFLGFTHNDYYEYSAIAITPVKLLEMSRLDFLQLTDQISQLKRNLAQINNNVLSRALDQIFALGQKKAHERLCFLIEQVRERYPAQSSDQVQLPMTRQDIADYLGLTIETVSRALGRLKKDRIITDVGLQSLTVMDNNALREMASLD
jgi:CRP/FNR family transcriptional regulator